MVSELADNDYLLLRLGLSISIRLLPNSKFLSQVVLYSCKAIPEHFRINMRQWDYYMMMQKLKNDALWCKSAKNLAICYIYEASINLWCDLMTLQLLAVTKIRSSSDNFADPRFQLLSLPSPYYNDFIDTIWNYNIPASSASADMKKLFRQT